MEIEHHRDLAHEFPEFKQRIHELKVTSAEFRHLYKEYQELDKEIYRIEQDIETTSDAYAEELKLRRVRLKDHLYGLLTGQIKSVADAEEYFTRGKFARPVHPGAVARDWIERGFSCHGFTDPPGQEWRDFVHDTDEVVTVTDGQLEITLGDRCWLLQPGDELFIPRGALHTVRNTHDRATHWLYGYD